jgi:hypothetical protein
MAEAGLRPPEPRADPSCVYEHEGTTPEQSQGTPAPKVERRFVGSAAAQPPRPDPSRAYKPDPAWNKLLLVVGAIAVVGALLVVPGILNRGGQNPVAAAAEATSNAPGVRFTFTGRALGAEALTMSGKGLMNGETNRLSLAMSATGSTAAGAQSFTLQEVVDDGDLYLSSPELGAAFGGSGRWMLVRSEALGNLLQADASGAGMAASPSQHLDALQDASHEVSEVGRVEVNGVPTTHYSALLDVGELANQLKDEVSGEFGDLVEESMDQISSAKVDVWIDDEGLLRRESSSMSSGSLGNFTMTTDFTDYGIRPDIQIPQGSEVFDVTPFMEKALDELSD